MTVDPILLGQMNQLKGLILQVKSNTDGLVENLSTVDFCCDMFDRGTRGVLDGYWEKSGAQRWTIRDGVLLQQAQVATKTLNTSTEPGYSTHTYTPNTINTTYANLPFVSDAASLYSATMSSSDLQILVDFDISPSYLLTNPSGFQATTVGQAYGACFGLSSTLFFGLSAFDAYRPDLGPLGVVSLPGYTLQWARLSDAFGFTNSFVSISGGDAVLTPASSSSPGRNSLLFSVSGNTYVTKINGNEWHRTTTAIMPIRNRVGIMAPLMSQVASFLSAGLSFSGISKFKAWPIGMPEPPNQTGHGNYIGDAVQYTDKYHDLAGNYNPEA